ncbi:perilipin-3-like isoform X2 [Dermochelys coriacea]|uniref:perilipin-3-like isoform X2 n=1 Tax=Dermochelys coriacea TaxID=27794 RepID=UPI001CA8FCF3|nr:perilipin-3-like isoform X2 [Dermochelys coriacea]
MASENKTTNTGPPKAEEEQQANIVNRVASLPFVSSAYNLVSSAYSYTKGTHPYVSNVCSVAEIVAAMAVGSTVGGVQPILSHLEPQIASVNKYACKGLDKLEESLPFLHQPTEKVISDIKQMMSTKVMSAVDAAYGTKDAVASRVAGAVDVTKDVVQDSVELTKSVMSSTVNTAKEAAYGAKDIVTNRVIEAVDLTRGTVQDSVELTKSVVSSTVNTAKEAACGAKDIVTNRVTEAVDLTRGTVQDSVELTKSVVSSTVNTAKEAACGAKDIVISKVNTVVGRSREAVQDSVEMTSFVVTNSLNKAKAAGQLVTSGVDAVLEKSEVLVDHYLPMTNEELVRETEAQRQGVGPLVCRRPCAMGPRGPSLGVGIPADNLTLIQLFPSVKLAIAVEGFNMASVEEQKQQQSYFMRLGSLSNKVRHRAYQHSLNKLRLVKQNTQDSLSQLQLAINLIEYIKQSVGQKLQDSLEKLQQLGMEWSQTQPRENPANDASQPEVESRTLAMVSIIIQQLHPAYVNLVSSIQGLPSSIQETVQQAVNNIQQLHTSFSRADSFQDLSSSSLTQSREKLTKAQESLDALLEYVAHNTSLNWLVGPFAPSVRVTQEAAEEPKEIMTEMLSPARQELASAQKKVAEIPKAPEKEIAVALKEEKIPNAPKEAMKALKKAVEELTRTSEKMVAEKKKEDP